MDNLYAKDTLEREAAEAATQSEDVLDQQDNISLDELHRQERRAKGW
jgi:hypothetical protein